MRKAITETELMQKTKDIVHNWFQKYKEENDLKQIDLRDFLIYTAYHFNVNTSKEVIPRGYKDEEFVSKKKHNFFVSHDIIEHWSFGSSKPNRHINKTFNAYHLLNDEERYFLLRNINIDNFLNAYGYYTQIIAVDARAIMLDILSIKELMQVAIEKDFNFIDDIISHFTGNYQFDKLIYVYKNLNELNIRYEDSHFPKEFKEKLLVECI